MEIAIKVKYGEGNSVEKGNIDVEERTNSAECLPLSTYKNCSFYCWPISNSDFPAIQPGLCISVFEYRNDGRCQQS